MLTGFSYELLARCAQVRGDGPDIRGPELTAFYQGLAVDEQELDARGGAQDEGSYGVRDAGVGQVVGAPEGDIGELAGFERADLRLTAEAAGAVDGGELERLPRRETRGSPRETGEEQRLPHLHSELPRLVRCSAVDAQAHGGARPHEGRDRGDASP